MFWGVRVMSGDLGELIEYFKRPVRTNKLIKKSEEQRG